MVRIVSSVSTSTCARKRARLWYDEGRTLGLEQAGLYLRLPEGWNPDPEKQSSQAALVRLPSGGSLHIAVFRSICTGLDGLKNLVLRRMDWLTSLERLVPCTFGSCSANAYRFQRTLSWRRSSVEGVMGLHQRGGYALVLRSDDPVEKDLFRRLSAKAELLDRKQADHLRREALRDFKQALKERDPISVERALSTLILFSHNRSAACTIAGGLHATEEIQVSCAEALGRMGSEEASAGLERALQSSRVCDPAKSACINALLRIGGPRERKILQKLSCDLPIAFSPELRNQLMTSLQGFCSPGE
jgi:hypothetical protein